MERAIQEAIGKIKLAEHDEEENEKARENARKLAEKEVKKHEVDYKTINKYSWEDTGKFIKVYVLDLEGIKDVPADDIKCDFETNSFEMKIKGLNGKNLRLQIDPMFGDIDEKASKLKLKSSSLTIQMRKADFEVKWKDIKYSEGKGANEDMGGGPPGGMFGGGADGGGGMGGGGGGMGGGGGGGGAGGMDMEAMQQMMAGMGGGGAGGPPGGAEGGAGGMDMAAMQQMMAGMGGGGAGGPPGGEKGGPGGAGGPPGGMDMAAMQQMMAGMGGAGAGGAGAGGPPGGEEGSADMMKTMQDMYENGDDETKKTIEESMKKSMGGEQE